MGLKNFNSQWIKNLKSPQGRPPLEALYIYVFCILLGYGIADLTLLHFRPMMLPQKAPPEKPESDFRSTRLSASDFRSITQRNIFNDDGKIPPALSAGEKKQEDFDGPATKSRLPLKLLGTIVHVNPERSIATINQSNNNEVQSFRVGERIGSMAEITKIERRKVTFRNLASRRMEYIDIPDEGFKVSLASPVSKPVATSDNEVQKDGEFRFRITRDDLSKYTSDLANIIKQARMVPNLVPGSGGKVDGFRFVSIQPDSIFARLGFKPGDIIKGVNGEPVSSPTQAMELYQSLKNSDSVNLSVNRDGRDEVFDYTIE